MTVTASPVAPARARGPRGARPAPYIAASGDEVRPGCYGISDGGSITGDLIRHAAGTRAGHAFVYIGHGQVVEAAPPGVRVSAAASHPGAIWNTRCPLTAAQRARICARAVDPVFKADHWQVCSALVADCYAYAGLRIQPGLRDLSLAGLDTWTGRPLAS